MRTREDAVRLAQWLESADRGVPVVLISPSRYGAESFLDVDRLEAEASASAEIYLLASVAAVWALRRTYPPARHLYAGSARVVPVGGFVAEVTRLHVAGDGIDRVQVARELLDDVRRCSPLAVS
ncbi:hypothetical protein [Ruania alba]|uniref:hypothetical protein n=1 Tax=Ruania alba TaxID=648782 RepID=UPI001113C513|nr:hypothetical protein [Ruania alba]